jgi:predicted DNA-binding transcriptional regulator AlpA
MTPSEFLYHLKQLPANTPVTATHIAAILETLAPLLSQKPQADYDNFPSSKLIDEETLAEWLGESASSLQKWRLKGAGPNFVKGPKSVRYSVGAVRDWIASRTVNSTSEATVKGLNKLESINIASRLHMPWSDPYPVMITDGNFIGFFRSVQEHLEVEPETFCMIQVRELSALHPPKQPSGLDADAAPLLSALGEFSELVIRDPKKAREIYGEWEQRLNDSERFGFLLNAMAFDLDLAKHIGKRLPSTFIASYFNPSAWLWVLLANYGDSDLYSGNLQGVFSYLSDMGVDINQATVIEERSGQKVFSGTVAQLLADTTAEYFHIFPHNHAMQYYGPLVSTLLALGLSVDIPSDEGKGITARQIADAINSKHGPGTSPFAAVLKAHELQNKLRSELAKGAK